MRSYAANVASFLYMSMVASSRPAMLTLSATGMRSNSGNVARTCPSGDGSSGNLEEENTD